MLFQRFVLFLHGALTRLDDGHEHFSADRSVNIASPRAVRAQRISCPTALEKCHNQRGSFPLSILCTIFAEFRRKGGKKSAFSTTLGHF